MSIIQSFQVLTQGAELASVIANDREYLWQGDSHYWGRRAPILFPIVGKLANNTLCIDGKTYTMNQHGFARDADFVQTQFTTSYNPLTGFRVVPSMGPFFMQMVKNGKIENYPYDFNLKVRYAVFGNTLDIDWEVENIGDRPMYFQIGAHPAFLLPDYNENHAVHGYLRCYNRQGKIILPISTTKLVDGLRQNTGQHILSDKEARIPITNDTFANGALLLEGCDVKAIELIDVKGKEILRVSCPQADAFGIWAPNKPGCPFICIEPWCGVADRMDFKGDIKEKDFVHQLAPQEVFSFDYSISILG